MLFALTLALVASAAASRAVAQGRPRAGARGADPAQEPLPFSRTVSLSVFSLFYSNFDPLYDPSSASNWALADNAFGAGGGVLVQLSRDFALGGDAAFTRTRYERRTRTSAVTGARGAPTSGSLIASGNATVATVLLSGVYRGGLGLPIPIPGIGRGGRGGARTSNGGAGTYFTAGLGATEYWLDDLDGGNLDLAFMAGAGFDYAWSGGRAAFLEYKRVWGIHEREGVESGTASQSRFDLGVRIPVLD